MLSLELSYFSYGIEQVRGLNLEPSCFVHPPPGFNMKNSAPYPNIVRIFTFFACLLFLQQHQLIFLRETRCILCEVRTESLYKTHISFSIQRV
jgi:hypothetical protein